MWFVILWRRLVELLRQGRSYGFSLVFFGLCSNVFAYDPVTHSELTAAAVSKSVIMQDADFMNRLGLEPLTVQRFFKHSGSSPVAEVGSPVGLVQLMRYGAEYEDLRTLSRSPVHLAFYHFYDPQSNFPRGRGLTVPLLGEPGAPSPDWILETRGVGFPDQYYSYRKANQQLIAAFSAPQPYERQLAFSMVFQSLGHIVHHLQDMAQPQHVRNEPHLPVQATSLFEDESKLKLTPAVIKELVDSRNYPMPSVMSAVPFKKASDYWHGDAPGYSGMAEFASKNFVTSKTGYVYTNRSGVWRLQPYDESLPLPSGINALDGSEKKVEWKAFSKEVKLRGGRKTTLGPYQCVTGKVFDGFDSSRNSEDIVQACESIRSTFSPGYKYLNWDLEEVRDATRAVLVPRAVSFSAGLINHFFRGRVGLKKNEESGWTIFNDGPESTSGYYSIFSEDAVGVRSELLKVFASIPSGGGVPVDFNPPDDTSRLVVLFSGTMGEEHDVAHGRVLQFSKSDTSSVVSASPASILHGGSSTFTVTVAGKKPSGKVQFFINNSPLGVEVVLGADGTATVGSGNLSSGSYRVYASYSGDYQNKKSISSDFVLSVAPPSPPPVPCGVPISASGGPGTFSKDMAMGSVAGDVRVLFDAFLIPDGLEVRSPASGKVLAKTGGLVSGLKAFKFFFNPKDHNDSSIIRFVVNGNNDPHTRWEVKAGCPGEAPPAFQQFEVLLGVTKPYVQPGTICGGTPQYGFFLNGALVAMVPQGGATKIKLTASGVHFMKAVIQGSWPASCLGLPYFNSGKGNVNFFGDSAVIYPNQTSPGGQAN